MLSRLPRAVVWTCEMTRMWTLLSIFPAITLAYLIGRYRRTAVWKDLRQTLEDRTRDRNHWMHESEKWQAAFEEEWWTVRRECAESN